MTLHEIIENISQIEDAEVSIGYGPKHPVHPQSDLTTIVTELFSRYPFLKKDQGYVEFMETFSGMYIYRPKVDISLHIFGFTNVSLQIHKVDENFLLQGEKPIIEKGFLGFCDADLFKEDPPVGGIKTLANTIGTGFAFDATGQRKWGIYRAKNILEFEAIEMYWYCNTFLEWLDCLLRDKGNLAE